jgi:hypothetical protein
MGRVQSLAARLEHEARQCEQQGQRLQSHFAREGSRLQAYYNCLARLVQAAHEKSEQDLREAEARARAQLEGRRRRLESQGEGLAVVQRDIESTRDTIVRSVPESSYRPIMDCYRQLACEAEALSADQPALAWAGVPEHEVEGRAALFSEHLHTYFLLEYCEP